MLCFGHNVLIAKVTNLQKRTLVGKWNFTELSEGEMRNWVALKWKSLLGYMPSVVILMGGWYSFHFPSEEDLLKFKQIPWIKG